MEAENRLFILPLFGHALCRLLRRDNEETAIRDLKKLRKTIRESETAREALTLSPAKKRGRPPGSVDNSLIEEGVGLAMAVDWLGFKPAQILRALNRSADSDSPEYQWIGSRLKKGRVALANLLKRHPDLKKFHDITLPALPRKQVLADVVEMLRPLRRR
jgi:hypothetical protein